jgi:hypothetical protein
MAQTMVLLDLWMGGAGDCWLFALSVTIIAFKRKHATKKNITKMATFPLFMLLVFFFLNEFGNYSLYSLSRASLSSLRQVHGAQPVLLVPGRKHGEREHGGSCCALRRVPGQRGKRMGFDFVIKLLPLNLKSTRFVENELY